jgi:hypothetical protein
MVCEDVNRIHLTQGTVQWQVLDQLRYVQLLAVFCLAAGEKA